MCFPQNDLCYYRTFIILLQNEDISCRKWYFDINTFLKSQISTPFLGIMNTVSDSYQIVSLNLFTHLSQLTKHNTYILILHKEVQLSFHCECKKYFYQLRCDEKVFKIT